MKTKYIPQEIEPKWRKKWQDDNLYHAPDFDPDRPKYYLLTMLPYTSGDIHIGHWYAMTPADAAARFKRMNGYNVMFPIGFDAFGLPAEGAAIKQNIHPWKWTWDNVVYMRHQLRQMGAMWDWDREMVSCDPAYYKWTEWFFLQFYKHGLAYRALSAVDWCPRCNTTLAREQVWGDDRHCERCHTPVIKKELAQWFFRITNYAEELLDFTGIDWPERVKAMQTNWIGKSVGVEFDLPVEGSDDKIGVFYARHVRGCRNHAADFIPLIRPRMLLYAPKGGLQDCLVNIHQRHLIAVEGKNLSNAAAHSPCPDYAYFANLPCVHG